MRRPLQEVDSSCALEQLLERICTELPPLVIIIVLRPLPAVELARLACVHRALWIAVLYLRQESPGPRYGPPDEELYWKASGYSRLERAAAFGDVAVIAAMVRAGVDEHGTPLLRAGENVLESILCRLNSKYKKEKRPRKWATNFERAIDMALIRAVSHGHVHAAELLLTAGADVHALEESALRNASWHGQVCHINGVIWLSTHTMRQVDAVMLLLEHGANVHAVHGNALTCACTAGNRKLVDFLLLHSAANVHADSDQALRNAVKKGHTDIVALLIEHGANVRAQRHDFPKIASRNGYSDILTMLIQSGADVRVDSDFILRCECTRDRADLVALLLENGANVHAQNDEPLRQACYYGHTAVVDVLLKAGANVHAGEGYPLRAACRYNDHALIVGLLLEKGAAVDADMDEALMWASSHGHTDSVALLLQHGADATALKASVLLKASAYPATLELLLTHGACMREEEMLQARQESAGAEQFSSQLLAAIDTPIGPPDPSTPEIPRGYFPNHDGWL